MELHPWGTSNSQIPPRPSSHAWSRPTSHSWVLAGITATSSASGKHWLSSIYSLSDRRGGQHFPLGPNPLFLETHDHPRPQGGGESTTNPPTQSKTQKPTQKSAETPKSDLGLGHQPQPTDPLQKSMQPPPGSWVRQVLSETMLRSVWVVFWGMQAKNTVRLASSFLRFSIAALSSRSPAKERK